MLKEFLTVKIFPVRDLNPGLTGESRVSWPTRLTGMNDWSGIRTHASEETSALNWRLGPLGHPTMLSLYTYCYPFLSQIRHSRQKNKWLEWDSNPCLRRDQCLKLAPWTARPSNLSSLAAGFEPTRAEPIRFRVWPLNHSGMLTFQSCKPTIPNHSLYVLLFHWLLTSAFWS